MSAVNKKILERYHYRKIIMLMHPLSFENNSSVDQNRKIDVTSLFQRVGNDHTDICNVLHENNTNAIEKEKMIQYHYHKKHIVIMLTYALWYLKTWKLSKIYLKIKQFQFPGRTEWS